MSLTRVDSNVLLDVLTEDPRWGDWSASALEERAESSILVPDFYIGAHAAVSGMTLLTRDGARYRTYFPTLDVIAPG